MTTRTAFLVLDFDDAQQFQFVAIGQCATPGSFCDGKSRRLIGGNFSRESGPGVSSSVYLSLFFLLRLATFRGFFRMVILPAEACPRMTPRNSKSALSAIKTMHNLDRLCNALPIWNGMLSGLTYSLNNSAGRLAEAWNLECCNEWKMVRIARAREERSTVVLLHSPAVGCPAIVA